MKSTPQIGQSVICNGYPGTITKVCDGQLLGMVEVRLSRGSVCLGISDMGLKLTDKDFGAKQIDNLLDHHDAKHLNDFAGFEIHGIPCSAVLDAIIVWERTRKQLALRKALAEIAKVRPFNDDDAFNEYAVLQLEKGESVCGIRLA